MAKPAVSDLSLVAYSALGWFTDADEANEWALLLLVAALIEANLDPVYELAREREGEPAWSRLLDPVLGPARVLAYQAQFVGAVLTPGMDEDQQRAEIERPSSWRRGQTESIRLAAERNLTGEKWVLIRERKPEIGTEYVRTLLSETPDPDRTEADLRAATPAWLKLNYEAIEGVTWEDVSAGWEDFDALTAAFSDFAELADVAPDELPP